MKQSEIVQKALELLARRHVQLGVLETNERDESQRGYCVCGALLKAVEWKEPIGDLVKVLSQKARKWSDDTVSGLSEFSETYPTKDVLQFMDTMVIWFIQKKFDEQ